MVAYNDQLAGRIREFLAAQPNLEIEEKRMFRGVSFMVNGKMCVNVSNNNLMCRFDPALQDEVAGRKGFQTMIMNGRVYRGYCYVSEEGYKTKKNFECWLRLCLDFNGKAKAAKSRKK